MLVSGERTVFPLTGTETETWTRGEVAEASAHSWMDAGWLLCGVGLGSLGHKGLKAARSRVNEIMNNSRQHLLPPGTRQHKDRGIWLEGL